MKVYLKTKQDWIDFVNGKIVIAHKKLDNYFKEILVSSIEIILIEKNTVSIIKKY